MGFNDYVWTPKHVVEGGTGVQDGSSFADAFSKTGMESDLAPGRLYRMAPGFLPTSAISTVGTPGNGTNPIGFEGWKDNLSGPVDDFTDMCTISGAGHAGDVWLPGNYQMFRGLDVSDGGIMGFSGVVTRHSTWTGCQIRNNTTYGMRVSYNNVISRCRITGNGSVGLFMGEGTLTSCEIYDNGGLIDNVFISSAGASTLSHCYLGGGSNAIRVSSPAGANISFCTIDGATIGLNSSGSTGPILILANLITNNLTGMFSVGQNVIDYNNFYGNTLDQSALTKTFSRAGNFFVDPKYVDLPTHDYRIQNADLTGVSVLPMLGTFNIGASQGEGVGSGVSRGKTLKTGGMM